MVKRPTTQNSAKQQSLNHTLLTHTKGGEGERGRQKKKLKCSVILTNNGIHLGATQNSGNCAYGTIILPILDNHFTYSRQSYAVPSTDVKWSNKLAQHSRAHVKNPPYGCYTCCGLQGLLRPPGSPSHRKHTD